MAYDMHLKSKPTGGNQRMAAELAPGLAADALKAIRTAAEALNALSKTTDPTPEQTLSAVLTWHAGLAEISRLGHELLGCAVLGGAAVSTTATKLSVRPQTLSSWLAGTVADHRGTEQKRVGKGAWEPLQRSEQQVSTSEPQNPAEPAAASPPAGGPSTWQDAAGTGMDSPGTGQVSVGDFAPKTWNGGA
ncbi:Uncharacterised protein [Mycobacteroides abscessus subsp. abscessus]|uniref:hypothetical protein n=1 Tax=Mycobacteroides abscessus TaxID=36809 RepID=UPI000925E229|nr:hypothetical protein [Mycobacteroides abscessus]SHP27612.1 Uncharacterised protein [Mycobacteroides abscessus subsp. abscessus]SHP67334.1 Uncharacterised protein [Mycobacteroides abscessus subsp. abscessus]SHY38695.1 Uncharacterised protein [Mycobacteroides abscessus subsp. abscessus]SKD94823.1 Uncharacterised protein [Mycobacteroides abscessus subsp. abscessus]